MMIPFRKFVCVAVLLISGITYSNAQGTFIDFSTIPKSGTVLINSHMDDDLIWMLPFWQITEKFIEGAMPVSPSYRSIVSQQQAFLNNSGYNIQYQPNWFTPWDDVTDPEYTGYYLSNNPAYSYLLNDHLEVRLYNNYIELSRFEINKLKAKLEQYIASPDMERAITHNNWGEYGHRHHMGLNKAVRELAVKYRKDVWMLGCDNGAFRDVTVPNGITYTLGSFNDSALYLGIRTIYENNSRWTWYLDRVPWGDHKFIKVVDGGNDKSNILKGDEVEFSGPSQLEPGAYIFDGNDDYLTLRGNNNPSFTISMRIRPDVIREMEISDMSEYPGSDKNDRNIFLNSDGKITARIFDGSSKVLTSDAAIGAETWSHVAITGNGSSFRLYVNGILEKTVSTGTAITNYSTPELVLGLATQTGSNFKGQINNVTMYDRALSDNEIAVLSGMLYTITSGAGPGGSVNPTGSVKVVMGTDKTFAIIGDTGYGIEDVKADNVSKGAVSSYTFSNVTADHSISATFVQLASFTITSSAGNGGSVSPAGTHTVYQGTSQTYTIDASLGYRVADVIVDGVSAGSVTTYVFNDISASHTISATFSVVPVYTITATAGAGGALSPGGTVNASEGSDRMFTIIPDPGYNISEVYADGFPVGAVSTYTFSHITTNHSISASFSARTYALTSSAGSHGSISPAGVTTLNYGASQGYIITPGTGYKISNVLVDNVSIGAPSSYTFNNINADHTISATFSIITNAINASAGTGGSITPHGNVSVNFGADQSFSIAAATGYRISDVKVDNVSEGAVSAYTFNDVTEGHTISVTFESIIYSITSSSGPGGSISPSGTTSVSYGSDRTYTITPAYGYQTADVKVDNNSVGAVTSYTFDNITAGHSITASFTTARYSITGSAGTGGTITPAGTSTFNHGENRTYTVTPSAGYMISDVRVDNSSVGNVTSYTFSNIISNHTISVTFSVITYTLVAGSETGGSISPYGNLTVNYGTNRTFSITADNNYHILDVKVDDTSVGRVSSYTFNNITGDHEIFASFAHIIHTITGSSGQGGSISPKGETAVNQGADVVCTITPETGFLISDVKVDGVSVGKIKSFTFRNVVSNHSISATFTPVILTVKGSSNPGGSINSSGGPDVIYGTDLVYTITPDVGYQIEDVVVDGKSVGPVSTYTFFNINSDHTISVSFKIITFKISGSSGTGGSISPVGDVPVIYGSEHTYTIAPDSAYKILDVKVDGVSVGPVKEYSFLNVTANHSIAATFKMMDTFTISAIAASGGQITPSGSIVLTEGSDQVYQIVPDNGYRIYEVIVDNLEVGITNEYTFTDLVSDHNISVTFTETTAVNVYPNPFIEDFNINIACPGEQLFDLRITDLNGKVICTRTEIPGNTIATQNLQGAAGMFILNVYSQGKKIATVRLIRY